MIEKEYHYWFEPDERIEGLKAMFEGFDNAIKIFEKKYEEISWYDADFYYEETDLIYGVVLVSLQNYINKWCTVFVESRLFGCTKNYQFYERGSKIINNGITQIRLIVELANYFKHRDDEGNLQFHTADCLAKLNLTELSKKGDERQEDRLEIEGLLLLCSNEIDLFELLQIVIDWRENVIKLSKTNVITN